MGTPFLASDPCNPEIFTLEKNCLTYQSEQLIPKKKDTITMKFLLDMTVFHGTLQP